MRIYYPREKTSEKSENFVFLFFRKYTFVSILFICARKGLKYSYYSFSFSSCILAKMKGFHELCFQIIP